MNRRICVLQFSTHNEDCGIGKYQEQFVDGMSSDELYTEYFPYSPNQTKIMSKEQFMAVVNDLSAMMQNFDILHIQHELSFFKHNELQSILSRMKSINKKVLVTVHTAPDAQYNKPHLGGVGLKSLVHYLRSYAAGKRFLKKYYYPLKLADCIVVHNQVTKDSLIKHGIQTDHIVVIRHPVPVVNPGENSNKIRKTLMYKKGDVIFATVGFLSRAKGMLDAVKALTYLPDNYKLAIIGGNHPDSQDVGFYDELADLIRTLHLEHRVYITGFIKDDSKLHALIRECDLCVYPYDKQYYSYVSSGSLNMAIANFKPVIAYKTPSFLETNTEMPVVKFCDSPSYYELAKEIREINLAKSAQYVKSYAKLYAWDKQASNFIDIYRNLI